MATNNKKQYIAEFRESEYSILEDNSYKKLNGSTGSLANSVKKLADDLYSVKDHFLMELIQNSEDNDYDEDTQPKLIIKLLDEDPTSTANCKKCLCVLNNEKGFDEEDIKGISRIGASTKNNKKVKGYIGEKGIGFKSVFAVTPSPHIFSNGYQIKFYKEDSKYPVSYIVPYWVDNTPRIYSDNKQEFPTCLLLPLDEESHYLDKLQPELILFLKKLTYLYLEYEGTSKAIKKTTKGAITTLTVEEKNKENIEKYWIHTEIVNMSDINEDKRDGIEETEITIAFPLNKDDDLAGSVFAYLPTEIKTGFPFIINADFLLTADRAGIHENKQWNQKIIDSLAEIVANGLMAMKEDESLKTSFYRFIPLNGSQTPELFKGITNALKGILKNKAYIYTDQNQFVLPESYHFAEVKFRKLFDKLEDRPDWFNNNHLVHRDLQKYKKIINESDASTNFDKERLKTCLEGCLNDEKWLRNKDNQWFKGLYKYVQKLYSDEISNDKDSEILKRQIIKLSTGELIEFREDIYSPQSKEIKAFVRKYNEVEIQLIEPELVSKDTEELLKWFEIKPLTTLSYIFDQLLPSLKYIDLAHADIIELSRFILRKWKIFKKEYEIEDDLFSLESKLKNLPILLEDGEIVCKNYWEDYVIPREFDKKTGWQNIISKGDIDELRIKVLHKDYLKFRKDQSFSDFLDFAEVLHYPKLEDAPEYCQQKKSIGKKRESLIKYLKYITKIDDDSPIPEQIKQHAFLKTSKGIKSPQEVFKPKKSIKEIFGEKVPYLKEFLSPALINKLEIIDELNTDTLLKYLFTLSAKRDANLTLVKIIYAELDRKKDKNKIKKHFEQEKLVFVPDSKNHWYDSKSVIWQHLGSDDSKFPSLSTHYPDNLEGFFTKKLGVNQTADLETILEKWLSLQEKSNEREEVEAFMSIAIPRIIKAIEQPKKDKKLKVFVETAKIWTDEHHWKDSDDVYIPDDGRLEYLFKNDDFCAFPWKRYNSHEQQEALYKLFKLKKLSESVKFSIGTKNEFKINESNSFISKDTIDLICIMIANDKDKDLFDKAFETGFLSALSLENEQYGNTLEVAIRLGHKTKLQEKSAFFSIPDKSLYIREKDENYKITSAIAETLAIHIWGKDYKKHIDLICRLLSADPREKEYICNEKNWKLLDEAQIKKLEKVDKNWCDSQEEEINKNEADLLQNELLNELNKGDDEQFNNFSSDPKFQSRNKTSANNNYGDAEENKETGNKGEELVLKAVKEQGFYVENMNGCGYDQVGYDLKAETKNGETYYIEVKASKETHKEVEISEKQYDKAKREAKNYILAVVNTNKQVIKYIINPANHTSIRPSKYKLANWHSGSKDSFLECVQENIVEMNT